MPQTTCAYIGIGANLGDRQANIARAAELLEAAPGIEVKRLSSIIQTPAMGGPADSPPYLNCVAEIHTHLPARELLGEMLRIEREMGRVRQHKWEPRLIDLDLLLFGQEIIDAPGLTVPHPLMHTRRFVLAPLAELAPDVLHPSLGQTAAELLATLDASGG